jgi:hypothetical protein
MVKDDYLVSRVDIQEYAKRNTSPKMKIEQQYLQAYTDALLNSRDVMEKYRMLDEITCNGEVFNYFLSYWKNSGKVNGQVMRSVVAWSKLKKDERLFWLLLWALYTGYIRFYDNPFLEGDLAETTDEFPLRYTDEGLYTDMKGILGIRGIFPGFHCIFCEDPLDYAGEEWQTLDVLWDQLQKGKILFTMSKPGRITPFMFYQRWCYIGGDDTHEDTCGINRLKPFQSPFGWGDGIEYTDEDYWEPEKHLKYTDDPRYPYTDCPGWIKNIIMKMGVDELVGLYPVAHIEGEDALKDLPWGFRQWRWVRLDPAFNGYPYADYMLRIIFVLRIWKEQVRDKPDFAKDKEMMRDDIWPQVSIPSKAEGVPDVIFTPLAQPLQATSDFYFLQLEIRIPVWQASTWKDDNEWQDWWDWWNNERPVSPEEVPDWWQDWRTTWEG